MGSNKAAWLHKAGADLLVEDAPMPTAGPDEIIVQNFAVAINPLDWHMHDSGIFVQNWPAVFGCDVAGKVREVGSNAQGRFKEGDRVIGHPINLVTGLAKDAAYALYTAIPADKAAILPDSIPFNDGVVVPFALEAAVCSLSLDKPGEAMPGVSTPALSLPYPSLEPTPSSKTLVVYGGSSSVGSMTIQLASAAGIKVVAICSARNFDLARKCGASAVFDYHEPSFTKDVIGAVKDLKQDFVGIFDAISTPVSYEEDIKILSELDGGHLACVQPPPTDVPENVKGGMIFAVNDIATPVWRTFATPALKAEKLKCLPPPTIVGNGLEYVQEALGKSKAGVSGTKLVVQLREEKAN